jgi:hypothetical protein
LVALKAAHWVVQMEYLLVDSKVDLKGMLLVVWLADWKVAPMVVRLVES